MKKLLVSLVLLAVLMAALPLQQSAQAAQPEGYWPYYTAYEGAVTGGNHEEILQTGDALLAFYARFPMNSDIAGMSYNIYYYRYQNAVFEHRGQYDLAIDNAKKLQQAAEYLGFTDTAIAAAARIDKLDPMTEVYALTANQEAPLFYGAKNEPAGGTLFGRVVRTDSANHVANATALGGESITSVYVEAGENTAADFSWLIGQYDDGTHVLHIALNFPGKAETASRIVSGSLDSNLKETLSYLATLKSPVLLRIGGEMNLWQMDAGLFKSAYNHVAALARALAPAVALVWSPNCVGYWGSDLTDYYPGNELVDWVGMSLYSNSVPVSGEAADSDSAMYFGRGIFADCVVSAKAVDQLALRHNKPVIVTEGGTGLVSNTTGVRYDGEAVAQITKRYTALSMVYPNIKGLIYFDADVPGDTYQYAMTNSSTVTAAYDKAVRANPTLLRQYGGTAPTYTKLDQYAQTGDAVTISAYSHTLYGSTMTVRYYLNGALAATETALPYTYTLDVGALAVGKYGFSAVFDDGAGYTATKTYTLTKLQSGMVTITAGYDGAPLDGPSDWATPEVDLALDNSLVPDTMAGLYTTNITRLDFCRLVIRLLEQKTGSTIDKVLREKAVALDYGAFTDTVNKNVLAAKALGIVSGRGGGVFDGGAGITREEAAKMLQNTASVLGQKSAGAPPAFGDAGSFSSWAATSIDVIAATTDKTSGKTVMGGVGGGLFDPKGMYTYQQAYITMLRLFRA